jgi:hypothetical protein
VWGWLNDLWKFDPALGTFGEWIWVGGISTVGNNPALAIQSQPGVYGTLGVAAPANIPGGTINAMSWSDSLGNFWLFDGPYLWKFDPKLGTNGEWTWISGCSTADNNSCHPGVYGTLGTAASTNNPGGRSSAVGWSDASGNLWLFGGEGSESAGEVGLFNDLWEYKP